MKITAGRQLVNKSVARVELILVDELLLLRRGMFKVCGTRETHC